MSKTNEILVLAFSKGYRVTEDGVTISPKGKLLKTDRLKHIPPYLALRYKKTNILVHRLAAYQWFGEIIFRPDIQVRHLNGDSRDNRRVNLAVGSASDNAMDVPIEIRRATQKIASTAGGKVRRKLTSEQAIALRVDRKNGLSYKELMQKYQIAKGTVSYICNNKTYKEP